GTPVRRRQTPRRYHRLRITPAKPYRRSRRRPFQLTFQPPSNRFQPPAHTHPLTPHPVGRAVGQSERAASPPNRRKGKRGAVRPRDIAPPVLSQSINNQPPPRRRSRARSPFTWPSAKRFTRIGPPGPSESSSSIKGLPGLVAFCCTD